MEEHEALMENHHERRSRRQASNEDKISCTFSMSVKQQRKLAAIARALGAKTGEFHSRSSTLRWLIEAYNLRKKPADG